jgi:hypothetical protein
MAAIRREFAVANRLVTIIQLLTVALIGLVAALIATSL